MHIGVLLLPLLIGIPIILIGGKMARKYACPNCGNRVADRQVRICPVCHVNLCK